MTGTPARILADLRADGIAATSFAELFGDRDDCRWPEVAGPADAFAAGEKVRLGRARFHASFATWLAAGCPEHQVPTDYILFHDGPRAAVQAGDKLFRLGLDWRVRAIVNAYLGCRTSLRQYDLFCNLPLHHPARIRVSAQRWHRDRWNQVKLFLYFTDVAAGNGALEDIPQSRRGGRHASLWRFGEGGGPPGYLQPPDELIAGTVAARDRVLCSLPRGGMLFCDTSGLHRASLVETATRVLACWAYYPPTAQVARNYFCARRPSRREK